MNRFILASLLALACTHLQAENQVIEHRLQVQLHPTRHSLRVTDALTLPAARKYFMFTLHDGLEPRLESDNARLLSIGRDGHLARYAVIASSASKRFRLSYAGIIQHQRRQVAESLGRSHQVSNGYIGPEGVFLDAASGWYPRLDESLQRFSLQIDLPADWLALSQGEGPQAADGEQRRQVRWQEQQPQDDIYLIAAPFQLYRRQAGDVEAQVYLRQADPTLAERYLQATARYLALYQALLGAYPYRKFALAENFWPTGYGMPSFTLLGSQVIRLPFIADTSYPHEILHNWWGNGVYVDYASGNWSEGLTTYLADHLLQEQQGKGAFYRRDALQKFADHVRAGNDFPLRQFTARHSSASQSVGYGKGFMLFHMLRRQIGDQAFVDGLRRFYAEQRFRAASYADLRAAFEHASGEDLSAFFAQWLERTGAPMLKVSEVAVNRHGAAYRLSGLLQQTQDSAPFSLPIPLSVSTEDGQTLQTQVPLETQRQRFSLELSSRPLRLTVDPGFDLFRQLHAQESPAAFSALFGAEAGIIVLPAAAPPAMQAAYRQLAQRWSNGYPGWQVRLDSALTELPNDRPIWLLGWENRFFNRLAKALDETVLLNKQGARIHRQAFDRHQHSLALLAEPPGASAPLAWLGAHAPEAVPGLARKLPHYGKYALLAFTGEQPSNVLKQQGTPNTSPLSVALVEAAPQPSPSPLPALSEILTTHQP
jgi:aminopeptidase N